MKSSRRSASASILMCAAMVLLSACGNSQSEAGPASLPEVRVPTIVVSPVSTPVFEESPGTVVPAQTARIASRYTGYVHALDVDVGDTVKAGQRLLTIDNRDVEAQIAEARAALNRAQAAYADARFNFQRYSNLYREQAVSRQQYEAVKRNDATASAGVRAARAGLAKAEAQRAYTEVEAPFSGVITARYVEAGDLATPGEVLLQLQTRGKLEVHTQVTNKAYAMLSPGDAIRIVAGPVRTQARVYQLSPAADPTTETHLLKAILDPGSSLGAGDFVRVLVPVGTRGTLMVPDSAVVMRAGIPAVFIVDASDHAHLRMVRLGERRNGRVEILSGLTAKQRIIVAPGDSVENGTPIAAEQH